MRDTSLCMYLCLCQRHVSCTCLVSMPASVCMMLGMWMFICSCGRSFYLYVYVYMYVHVYMYVRMCVHLLVRVHSDVWVFVFGIHSYIYDIVCLAVSNREVVRQHWCTNTVPTSPLSTLELLGEPWCNRDMCACVLHACMYVCMYVCVCMFVCTVKFTVKF